MTLVAFPLCPSPPGIIQAPEETKVQATLERTMIWKVSDPAGMFLLPGLTVKKLAVGAACDTVTVLVIPLPLKVRVPVLATPAFAV